MLLYFHIFMSNKALWGIVGVVVLLAGIFWYSASKKSSVDAVADVQQETGAENSSELRSIKDLVSAGKSQMCTFTNSTDTSDSSGVIYVAHGMMRGDFDSVAKPTQTKIQSHLISDGTTNYVWTSAARQGYKMAVEQSSSGTNTQGSQVSHYQAVDYDQKLVYKCGAWTDDDSLFALPKGVQFMDMNDMMKQMMPKGMVAP